jgi:hypothetical protein
MEWHPDVYICYLICVNFRKMAPLLSVIIVYKAGLACNKPSCEYHNDDYKVVRKTDQALLPQITPPGDSQIPSRQTSPRLPL